MAVTLAHISDLHLTTIEGFTPTYWNLKRGFGYANWRSRRRSIHKAEVAGLIVADMWAMKPDHIAVTGDLVNLGLPAEFEAAARWLATVGPPDRVSVVPGNHDNYVKLTTDPGIARWQPYMTSDDWGMTFARQPGFPWVRRFQDVAMIGLCSGVPTPLFVAAGRLGAVQLEAMARILRELRNEPVARVVLIHHPPLPGLSSPRRGLEDATEFAEILAREGAELVLHGHAHRNSLVFASDRIPVIGVGSGSASRTHGKEPSARYNLITIDREQKSMSLEVRGLANSGRIESIERRRIS